MDSTEYLNRALETELKPKELNFGEVGLHVMLTLGIATAKALDMMKKTAFYGKPLDEAALRDLASEIGSTAMAVYELSDKLATKNDKNNYVSLPEVAQDINAANVNLRLLHSAVGIFTEGGELLEACRKQLETGQMDVVNFAEEIGDVGWYAAIGYSETGVSEAVVREKNIAKLAARKKTTGGNMINRDVVEERKILEEQVILPGGGLVDAKVPV